MSRPLRDRDPENYHLVTVRTEEARIWMLPCKKLNTILGGIIARYQELLNITIYTFCVLGNHLHIALKTPDQNLDFFMENVLREFARRVNKYNDRSGHFWSRRYDDQVILSEEDLLQAYLYVTSNAVKHGLVKDMAEWPGLAGYPQLLDEQARQYPFVHYSKKGEDGKPLITYHHLVLSPLPQHVNLEGKKRIDQVKELLQEYQDNLVRERLEQGLGFLGREALLRQVAGRLPVSISRSPRPMCYTTKREVGAEYQAERSVFRDQYCEASEEFRSGHLDAEFPNFCYKPPLHRSPQQRFAA